MPRPAWSLFAYQLIEPDEQLDLFACQEVRVHLVARQLELGGSTDAVRRFCCRRSRAGRWSIARSTGPAPVPCAGPFSSPARGMRRSGRPELRFEL
jgi:hypothetical protein